MKTILSLFDHSGNWSRPYREAGYHVLQHDLKLGQDIFEDTIPFCNLLRAEGITVHGILAAVPCTEFASSGARWWQAKDAQPAPYDSKHVEFDNRLDMARGMVLATLVIVEWLRPQFWALENPVGRIRRIVPEIGEPRLKFDPCEYGDPYTKRTYLYGRFNERLPKTPVLPLFGSLMHRMSGSWKEQRSVTPMGFARAFFLANP
jgi:hypothetical protein